MTAKQISADCAQKHISTSSTHKRGTRDNCAVKDPPRLPREKEAQLLSFERPAREGEKNFPCREKTLKTRYESVTLPEPSRHLSETTSGPSNIHSSHAPTSPPFRFQPTTNTSPSNPQRCTPSPRSSSSSRSSASSASSATWSTPSATTSPTKRARRCRRRTSSSPRTG